MEKSRANALFIQFTMHLLILRAAVNIMVNAFVAFFEFIFYFVSYTPNFHLDCAFLGDLFGRIETIGARTHTFIRT